MGLDIGFDFVKIFQDVFVGCGIVIWNGFMGVFEFDKFVVGIEAIVCSLVELIVSGIVIIIGGGDFVVVVEKVGVVEKMSYIFIGGGVSLELLEGKVLFGIVVLDD